MPIPEKRNTENEQEFLQRCMSDEVMTKEYPDKDQRYSICRNQIKGSK
jgi:hypothetical protein